MKCSVVLNSTTIRRYLCSKLSLSAYWNVRSYKLQCVCSLLELEKNICPAPTRRIHLITSICTTSLCTKSKFSFFTKPGFGGTK